MSLVNDLVIEVDRRRSEDRDRRDDILDGLSPAPAPARQKRRGMILITALCTVAIAALGAGLYFQLAGLPDPGLEESGAGLRPAVAARPNPSTASPPSATAIASPILDPTPESAAGLRFARPVSIRAVTLERGPNATRLRISADERTPYRIEGAGGERRLEIILQSAALRTAIAPLDLIDTPIRSLEARRSDGSMHLSLSLDEAVRVQSQWVEHDQRSSLVIDLQAPSGLGTGAAGASSRSVQSSTDTESSAGSSWEAADGFPSDHSLEIHRSADDHRRRSREAARGRAREALESARFARAEERQAEAMDLYRMALGHLPELREASVELGALLFETGQQDEAIELLRVARRRLPRDAQLTMFHARLLEQAGEIAAAIELLDGATLGLSEAPEVHALAAAYVQKAGDHTSAIDRYEAIVRRFPGEASWWMGLGISLEAQGRQDEALDVYRISLQVGELPAPTLRWISARVEALTEEG